MRRPKLTKSLATADFEAHYWLKSELVDFCRAQGISAAGGKIEITRRVGAFLETGRTISRATTKARHVATMPAQVSGETIIGPGWRCSEAVRDFFAREVGRSFRFNAAMRKFIHHGAGRKLGEGIAVWEESQRAPKGSSAIAPQFEFNRHMRAYFQQNPGGTHADAVKAWKKAKAARGRRRSDA